MSIHLWNDNWSNARTSKRARSSMSSVPAYELSLYEFLLYFLLSRVMVCVIQAESMHKYILASKFARQYQSMATYRFCKLSAPFSDFAITFKKGDRKGSRKEGRKDFVQWRPWGSAAPHDAERTSFTRTCINLRTSTSGSCLMRCALLCFSALQLYH